MLNEKEDVKYGIKVDGKLMPTKFDNKLLAQQHILNMLKEDQNIKMEVVAVSATGLEILLG